MQQIETNKQNGVKVNNVCPTRTLCVFVIRKHVGSFHTSKQLRYYQIVSRDKMQTESSACNACATVWHRNMKTRKYENCHNIQVDFLKKKRQQIY